MFGFFKKRAQDAQEPQTEKGGESLIEHFKKVAEDMGVDVSDAFETAQDAQKRIFQRGLDSFEFYEPPTKSGVKGKTFAMDAAEIRDKLGKNPTGIANPLKGGMNFNGYNIGSLREEMLVHFSHYGFIGFPMCAQLAVHPFIHIACAQPGKDAIATGFDFKFADKTQDKIDTDGDGSDDSLEYLSALKKKCMKLGIFDACAKLDYNKRVFGSGIAFPIVTDKSGESVDMSIPYNSDGLAGKKFGGWKVIDPIWLSPIFHPKDTFNPASKMFYKPSWYRLPDGRLVHHTWFIKVDSCEVADILKPTYYWCGVPLTQQIANRVWAFDKIADESPLLAMSKRMLIVDANVQQIYKNRAYVYKLMSIIKKCWHNWGVFFKNESSNVQQIDTNLAYLDEVIFTQGQLVASIAGMPATKLLKTTPKGFNATGEYEWKDYAQHIGEVQSNEFSKMLCKSVEMITACEGSVKVVEVDWHPVDAPTESEKAQVESTKANTRESYVSAGILTVEEVREAMRVDESGEFTHIKKDNPELDKKKQMEDIMRKLEEDDNKDKDDKSETEEAK